VKLIYQHNNLLIDSTASPLQRLSVGTSICANPNHHKVKKKSMASRFLESLITLLIYICNCPLLWHQWLNCKIDARQAKNNSRPHDMSYVGGDSD